MGAVPPSVTGEWVLTHNTYNANHDKINEGESWDWASSTIPNHRPGPGGAEWSYTFTCPYDSLLVPTGRFTLHHAIGMTDAETLDVSLVIRDWIIYGNDTAKYTLYNDGNSNVNLQIKGQVLSDVFPLTGLKYRLQIRKEGAGAGGIVYTGEGTIATLTPGSDRKFTITHSWNGKASVSIKMQGAPVVEGELVPGGRYQVEWTLLSCKEGLEWPLCLKDGDWVIDKNNPIKGGTVTVGDIALSEVTAASSFFLPDKQVFGFQAELSALPIGTRVFSFPVVVWVDVYDDAHAPKASPPGGPGQGNIATFKHVIRMDTVAPQVLRYAWTGGRHNAIIWNPSNSSQSCPSDRVPYGKYVILITAKPDEAKRGYHNAVATKAVMMIPQVSVDSFSAKPDGEDSEAYRIAFDISLDSWGVPIPSFLDNIEMAWAVRVFEKADFDKNGLSATSLHEQTFTSLLAAQPNGVVSASLLWDGKKPDGTYAKLETYWIVLSYFFRSTDGVLQATEKVLEKCEPPKRVVIIVGWPGNTHTVGTQFELVAMTLKRRHYPDAEIMGELPIEDTHRFSFAYLLAVYLKKTVPIGHLIFLCHSGPRDGPAIDNQGNQFTLDIAEAVGQNKVARVTIYGCEAGMSYARGLAHVLGATVYATESDMRFSFNETCIVDTCVYNGQTYYINNVPEKFPGSLYMVPDDPAKVMKPYDP